MKNLIKMALENIVLCRGAHSAAESYDYAAKMEKMIVDNFILHLKAAKDHPHGIDELIKELCGESPQK
jgi:hypothetical protein